MHCLREKAGSLRHRRRKSADEYSGASDYPAEQTSGKAFCDKQPGISFYPPDLGKLAPAYGFPYREIHSAEELPETIREVLKQEGAFICQVFVTKYQKTEPKTSSKKLPDGRMVSAPLEDMYPFLPPEEMEENMRISRGGR